MRSSLTIGVDLAGHLQGLRGGHVRVGRRDRQDDAVGVGDVLQDQVSDLDLDVFGLVTDWYLEAAKLKPKIKLASPRLTR